jgi:hypothetical protein
LAYALAYADLLLLVEESMAQVKASCYWGAVMNETNRTDGVLGAYKL